MLHTRKKKKTYLLIIIFIFFFWENKINNVCSMYVRLKLTPDFIYEPICEQRVSET